MAWMNSSGSPSAPYTSSLNQLIHALLPNPPPSTRLPQSRPPGSWSSNQSLRRRLQSVLLNPTEVEPSPSETQRRWNRILERRSVENYQVVVEELQRVNSELHDILDSTKESQDLWKSIDSIKVFLFELHSPPSQRTEEVAVRLREDRQNLKQLQSEAEIDAELYRSIIDSEPLVGDHWQTDIYAGSDSSLSRSSSLGNSPTFNHLEQAPKTIKNTQPNVFSKKSSLQKSVPDETLHPPDFVLDTLLTSKLANFQPYWRTSVWTHPLSELIAVREVISSLLDIGGTQIYQVRPSSTVSIGLSSNLPDLLHKSTLSTHSLFSSFLPLLNDLKTVRTQLELNQNHSVLFETRTGQAFKAALLDVIQKFDRFVSSIELGLLHLSSHDSGNDSEPSESKPVVVSLVRLHRDIQAQGWNELFSSLASIINKINQHNTIDSHELSSLSRFFFDTLYDMTCHFESYSNSPSLIQHSKLIFLQSCEPLWAWIGNWIMHGRLPGRSTVTTLAPNEEHPTITPPSSTLDRDHCNQSKTWAEDERAREFFIRTTPVGTSWSSENWWDQGYVLRTLNDTDGDAVPKFLYDFKITILEAGKARALSQILDRASLDSRIRPSRWPNLVDLMDCEQGVICQNNNTSPPPGLLRKHLVHPSFFHKAVDPKPSNSSRSAQSDLDSTRFDLKLHEAIENQMRQLVVDNHARLHSQLIIPYRLSTYLDAVNQFYLFGELCVESFVKMVFDQIEEHRLKLSKISESGDQRELGFEDDGWNDRSLNLNMAKALELYPSPIISRCLPKVKIRQIKKRKGEDRIEEEEEETDMIVRLELIQIDLKIPVPINYILDEQVIENHYNRIFRFLCQLNRASKNMDEMILIDRETQIKQSIFKKCNQKTIYDCNSFKKIKNRMNWFLNVLKDYLMDLIIKKWKSNVFKTLEDLNLNDDDFRMIEFGIKVKFVRNRLNQLMVLSFVSDQSKSIHQAIINIFKLTNILKKNHVKLNRLIKSRSVIQNIKIKEDEEELQKQIVGMKKNHNEEEEKEVVVEVEEEIDELYELELNEIKEIERVMKETNERFERMINLILVEINKLRELIKSFGLGCYDTDDRFKNQDEESLMVFECRLEELWN